MAEKRIEHWREKAEAIVSRHRPDDSLAVELLCESLRVLDLTERALRGETEADEVKEILALKEEEPVVTAFLLRKKWWALAQALDHVRARFHGLSAAVQMPPVLGLLEVLRAGNQEAALALTENVVCENLQEPISPARDNWRPCGKCGPCRLHGGLS